MKIVVNKCYGGFCLSRKAIEKYAEAKGRKAYLYKFLTLDEFALLDEGEEPLLFFAMDTGDGSQFQSGRWAEMTPEERAAHNANYEKHKILPENDALRVDPDFIKIVEELGKEASGRCADLKVIEIPDGIDWEVEEYDGMESVAEKHQVWS